MQHLLSGAVEVYAVCRLSPKRSHRPAQARSAAAAGAGCTSATWSRSGSPSAAAAVDVIVEHKAPCRTAKPSDGEARTCFPVFTALKFGPSGPELPVRTDDARKRAVTPGCSLEKR
ncbi:MAG: hypothetical protein Kow0010_22650 [Dehalococcoidia bacterium]